MNITSFYENFEFEMGLSTVGMTHGKALMFVFHSFFDYYILI